MDVGAYVGWVTLGAIIVLLAEVIAGRHKGVYGRKGEFRLLVLNVALGRFVIAPVGAIGIAAVWSHLFPHYRGALGKMPLWLALPLVMLVAEFCFYWVHRWAHEGVKTRSWLWMIHRTHHSAPYMNVSVWMRLNMWWTLIIPHAWTMSLAIYLGLAKAAGITIVFDAVWNVVTHSDFRWDDAVRRHRLFGPLFRAAEHVFVSPGIHHTHHGFGKDGASYRNYGTMLSVWDWVFGTLHIPEGRPYRYGIPGHDAHWLEELAYPLVRMGKTRNPDSSAAGVSARE
jgi:sterol desaturase/sphingolipid hydroxylase (fatty acid hydroxylase superfamily)